MKDQIAQRVIGVIASYAELETGQVSLNTSFEDLGLDSLDALSLITELEDEFDISISDDEVYSISTVHIALVFLQGASQGRCSPLQSRVFLHII